MPPISEQMKAWSAALAAEVGDWPQVSQKVFFGSTALYRGKIMFGILPRTRCMESRNAIAFSMDATQYIEPENTRWFTFELSTDSDLNDALNWLGDAYDAARFQKPSK